MKIMKRRPVYPRISRIGTNLFLVLIAQGKWQFKDKTWRIIYFLNKKDELMCSAISRVNKFISSFVIIRVNSWSRWIPGMNARKMS